MKIGQIELIVQIKLENRMQIETKRIGCYDLLTCSAPILLLYFRMLPQISSVQKRFVEFLFNRIQ